jgi:hypothetical protein
VIHIWSYNCQRSQDASVAAAVVTLFYAAITAEQLLLDVYLAAVV